MNEVRIAKATKKAGIIHEGSIVKLQNTGHGFWLLLELDGKTTAPWTIFLETKDFRFMKAKKNQKQNKDSKLETAKTQLSHAIGEATAGLDHTDLGDLLQWLEAEARSQYDAWEDETPKDDTE